MYGREYIEWLEGRKEPSWATWRRYYQDQEEGLRAALARCNPEPGDTFEH